MEEKKTNSVVFGGNIEWHTTGKPKKGYNSYLTLIEYKCKGLKGRRYIRVDHAHPWHDGTDVKVDKFGFVKVNYQKVIAWAEIPAETYEKFNIVKD